MTNLAYSTAAPPIDMYFHLFESTGWNVEYRLSKEELETSLRNSFHFISVYDEDRLVGFGRIVSDGILHAMIYEMIVLPDYQNRGIGSEVLERLLKKCREKNIRDVQLFCAKGKRTFYEKHGFEARPNDAPGMQLKKGKCAGDGS